MKLSAVAVLLAASSASAYTTPSRASLRSLGQKSVAVSSGPRRNDDANLKMEGEHCIIYLSLAMFVTYIEGVSI